MGKTLGHIKNFKDYFGPSQCFSLYVFFFLSIVFCLFQLERNINKKEQKASPRVGGWGSRQYSKEKEWDLSPVLLVLWKCFMKGRELYFTQDLMFCMPRILQ